MYETISFSHVKKLNLPVKLWIKSKLIKSSHVYFFSAVRQQCSIKNPIWKQSFLRGDLAPCTFTAHNWCVWKQHLNRQLAACLFKYAQLGAFIDAEHKFVP